MAPAREGLEFFREFEAAQSRLARISHRLTGQAHERPAITSLRLLAVLNGL